MPRIAVFGSSHVHHLGEFVREEPEGLTKKQKKKRAKAVKPFQEVHFVGHEGLRTDDVQKVERQLLKLYSLRPDVVIIFLGDNDIDQFCTVRGILTRLASLRDRILRMGAQRVIVSKILVRGKPCGLSPKGFGRIRSSLNRLIGKTFQSNSIDMMKKMSYPAHFSKDGVHLNFSGQLAILKRMGLHLFE